MRRPSTTLALVGLCIACGDESTSVLPELRYIGEHVRVGTDFDVPICQGNLDDFDREIERLESRLELDAQGKTDLWILQDGSLYEMFCPDVTRSCEAWSTAGGALMRQRAPDMIWHALAHDRVNRAAREDLGSSSGLFVEGLSEGLARAYCEPSSAWELALPSTDELLSEGAQHPDFTFADASLAGHMMRWLLETRGPQAVQEFMVDVDMGDDADTVRAVYADHFGTALDDDLFGHLDWSIEERHPYEVGCRGEPPPVSATGTTYTLNADLDCDSELVRSNYYEQRPEHTGKGYVEWALRVETGGYYEVVGELPEATTMTIALCDCQTIEGGYWPGSDPTLAREFTGEYLSPGLYRVVWKGPLDSETVLSVEIVRS